MKSHTFHPEADEEYGEAAAHYAKIAPELGGRFYDEIERLIADACAAPHRFRRIDGDVRRHLAEDFRMPCSISTSLIACGSSPSCR